MSSSGLHTCSKQALTRIQSPMHRHASPTKHKHCVEPMTKLTLLTHTLTMSTHNIRWLSGPAWWQACDKWTSTRRSCYSSPAVVNVLVNMRYVCIRSWFGHAYTRKTEPLTRNDGRGICASLFHLDGGVLTIRMLFYTGKSQMIPSSMWALQNTIHHRTLNAGHTLRTHKISVML